VQTCGQSYKDQVDDLLQLIEILSRRQENRSVPVKLPQWASFLDTQGRKYLSEIADSQSISNASTSYSLLISRFSEYLLRQHFFLPLASLVEPSECISWQWAQNGSSYLLDRTQRPPTLGDIVSLIKTMAHASNQSSAYIRMLRHAAYRLPIDFERMFSYDFVGNLCRLRDYRNCIMHAGEPSADELAFATLFVFGGNYLGRGQFVSCLLAAD